MFIAALFIIPRTWKQPKCPTTEEWIKKMRYTHTHTHTYIMEYHSAIKSNEIIPFAETWVDLGTIKQSEVSQKEKNNIIY